MAFDYSLSRTKEQMKSVRKKTCFLTFLVTIFFWNLSNQLSGATYQFNLDSGFLMQPTSQYYHFAYGASLESTFLKKKYFRLDYVERPKFSAQGFEDQDSLMAMSFGFNLVENGFGPFSVDSYLGYGSAQGYIKELSTGEARSYSISGPMLTARLAKNWSRFSISILHQYFVGLATPEEIDAYVAWPMSITKLSIGVVL